MVNKLLHSLIDVSHQSPVTAVERETATGLTPAPGQPGGGTGGRRGRVMLLNIEIECEAVSRSIISGNNMAEM